MEDFFWWNFFGEFFFDGIFLVDFFGRNFLGGFFLGGIFWEDFFGKNSTKIYLHMEGIDLFVKILVFVKILYLRKGRKEENLNL